MTIENNNRSLSPQSVGREFVRQYYTLLNEAPAHLHRFYNNSSSFVHGGLGPATREMPVVVGQRLIHQQIQQLNFRDCHAKISQVDSQATLDNGVVVQVSGELSNAGQPMRRFTQTFVLAAQSPKKYYVHNDIFRYQDLLSDEELENDLTRSEAEDEHQNGGGDPHNDIQPVEAQTAYYGGVNQVVNGIPEPKTIEEVQPETAYNNIDMIQQQAPTLPDAGQIEQQSPANQGPYVMVDMPPQQPEPTPEFHMSSQPTVVQPQIVPNNEPKTYANLVKQGHQVGGTVYYNSSSQSISQQSQQHTSETESPPPHIKNDKVFEPRPVQNSPKPQRMDGQPQRNNYISAARQANNEDSNGGSNGNYTAADGDRRRNQYGDNHQVFVGNIPHNASVNDLRELFGQFGVIVDFKILSKSTSKGGPTVAKLPFYGFIIFEDVNSVQAVLNAKPILFPDENGVRLNVEEKKIRRGEGGGRGRSGSMMGRGGGGTLPRGGHRSGVRFSTPVTRR